MFSNFKKLFYLIILVILITSIWSCGVKSKGVHLTMAFWGSAEEIEIIEKTVKPWDEKRDDLYVSLQHVPIFNDPTRYVQKIVTQIVGGTAPDVVFMEVNIFVDFFWKDALMDLAPFIEKEKEFNINDFYPDVVKRLPSSL